MFITMEEFRAQPSSLRHKPLNCLVGSSGSGKTATAATCNGCWFIPSDTTRAERKSEPSRIDLTDFMIRSVYAGRPLFRITRKSELQEYVGASLEEFAELEAQNKFLWTYTSNRGDRYGTLEVLAQAALASRERPSIMIVSPEAAIWLANECDQANCFFLEAVEDRAQILQARGTEESILLRLQEEESWKEQVEESDVPFVRIPAEFGPWQKARFIKDAIKPPNRTRAGK